MKRTLPVSYVRRPRQSLTSSILAKHSQPSHPVCHDDDYDDGPRGRGRPYRHYEHTYTAQQIHFYLSEGVVGPEEYTDMIHRISTASESDTIYIHLNTPGGRMDTGVQLINAMQTSSAHVVTILESESHSLGTLIFLAGDEMVVHDHVMIMFHNFKGGVVGKGHEQLAQLDATIRWFTELARELYIPFLSEEEFDRIIRGEDLWMHTDEIRKRIETMLEMDRASLEQEEETDEEPAPQPKARRTKSSNKPEE